MKNGVEDISKTKNHPKPHAPDLCNLAAPAPEKFML
jgi:hypothetical protein